VLALLSVLVVVNSQTVQTVINNRGCGTEVVAGLARQLIEVTNSLQPGLFSDLRNVRGVTLTKAVQAVPYLQTAALNALQRAVNSRGKTLQINSALRTLPQQLLLYKWYTMGACGIPVAAKPGSSNHNGGLAVDVADPYSWVSAMSSASFRHLGAGDPPHFDYKGAGATDVRSLSVRAFQTLWNRHNPNDRLPTDGVYSSAVESRLLRAPANGFSGNAAPSQPSQPSQPSNNNNGGSGRTGPACKGISGVCVNTNQDSCSDGTLRRGYCPGAANIVCCQSNNNAMAAADNTTPLQTVTTQYRDLTLTTAVIVVGAIVIAGIGAVFVLLARKIQNYEQA